MRLPICALLALTACARTSSTTQLPRFYKLSLGVMGGVERPRWQSPSTGMSAAFVTPTEGGGIVVGETEMATGINQHARMPVITSVTLFDADGGQPRWTAKGLGIPYADAALLATNPIIAIRTAKGVLGLDPRDGRERWTISTPLSSTTVAGSLLLGIAKGASELQAYDLNSGSLRWRNASGCAGDGAMLAVAGNLVHVASRGVCVFGLDGRPWGSHGSGNVTAIAGFPDGIAVGDAAGNVVRLAGGRAAWWARVAGEVKAIGPLANGVVVTTDGLVTAFEVADGHERWKALLSGSLQGVPTAVADRVVFSTDTEISVLDGASGNPLGSVRRPPAFARGKLADRIVAFDDHATVVGETGIAAVGVGAGRDGQLLWKLDLHGVDSGTYEQRVHEVERRVRTVGVYMSPEDISKLNASVGTSNAVVQQTIAESNRIAQRQQQLSSKAQWTSADFAEYKVNSEYAKAEATMGLAAGMVGMASAAFTYAVQANLQAMERRSSALLQHTLALHQRAVQGDHYVRPIAWTMAQGVLVVNLRDGRWREVFTSPGEPFVENFYLPGSPSAFDARTQRLYTLALGGNPETWQPREDYPGLVIGRRSALAYDLAATAWRTPDQYGR